MGCVSWGSRGICKAQYVSTVFGGDDEKKVLERFVIIMYNRSSSPTDIDSVRMNMFARKQMSYDALLHI